MAVVGVLGGSGVYDLDGLRGARWEKVESSFGAPSDELLRGELDGVEFVFLPRHGRGHRIPPSEVDYRANVDALKRAGVTDLVSVDQVDLVAYFAERRTLGSVYAQWGFPDTGRGCSAL